MFAHIHDLADYAVIAMVAAIPLLIGLAVKRMHNARERAREEQRSP